MGWWHESPAELIPTNEQVAAVVEVLRQRPDADSPESRRSSRKRRRKAAVRISPIGIANGQICGCDASPIQAIAYREHADRLENSTRVGTAFRYSEAD